MIRSREIFTEFEQGGLEWHNIRLGRITASKAELLLVAGTSVKRNRKVIDENPLKIGAALRTFAVKVAANIINGQYTIDDIKKMYSGKVCERGHELEPIARSRYQDINEWDIVQEVGFCSYGEYAGASPDGLVNDDGGIEIKCPEHPEYHRVLKEYASGEILHKKEYVAQCHFNMFVTNRKWWDMVYFHPKYGVNELIIDRIHRDEKINLTMETKIDWFEKEVKGLVELARTKVIKGQNKSLITL